jgi:glutamate synthase (NADPH/NADH) small chain
MPTLFEVASAHEEFGDRTYLASTIEFVGENGQLTGVKVAETEFVNGKRLPKAGTEKVIPADLVLLALGFTGVESEELSNQSSIEIDERGNVSRSTSWSTNADGVFVAGDAGRGQSLIVWAIAEGRAAAASIDEYLEGTSQLPRPVKTTDRPISI